MKEFDEIRRKFKAANKRYAEIAAEAIRKDAAREAPKDQGLLSKSHKVEKINDLKYIIGPDSDVLRSEAEVDYSPFVYFGTRPHVIRAKRASVLTDGTNFFGPKVNHPGTASNRWLDRTSSNIAPRLERMYVL